jgi:hypothetical protein
MTLSRRKFLAAGGAASIASVSFLEGQAMPADLVLFNGMNGGAAVGCWASLPSRSAARAPHLHCRAWPRARLAATRGWPGAAAFGHAAPQ